VKNAQADQVKAALKAGGLADNIIPIPFTVTVVKMKGKYVMFDSGTGGQVQSTAGLMAAKNIKPPASTRQKSKPSSSRISIRTTSSV
jgi:hypothetical protein